MNVFDFDGTIYKGDSSRDFYFYCIKHYKKTRKRIFSTMMYGIGYGLRFIKKIKFKQKLFSMVADIEDIDTAIEGFWQEHEKNIKSWYLEMKEPTDVIISASPEFLLEPICKKLGVECLMASRVDKKTGLFDGKNCHGQEKVERFHEAYPNGDIDEFYSDLYCDTPLARLAKRAYIVKGERLNNWKKFK